jgi:hypothetical protein
MSFPPATEMFQFAGFASPAYGFSRGYPSLGGLPHSEIPGSTIARISPGLFAACHVLHRLSVPRHPPDALNLTLDRKTRRLQGQAPTRRASHEDTLLVEETACSRSRPRAIAGPVRHREAARLFGYSLFTLSKITPAARRPPANDYFTRSKRCRQRTPGAPGVPAREVRVVEVNGIEPMTSCLQSRRSPN